MLPREPAWSPWSRAGECCPHPAPGCPTGVLSAVGGSTVSHGDGGTECLTLPQKARCRMAIVSSPSHDQRVGVAFTKREAGSFPPKAHPASPGGKCLRMTTAWRPRRGQGAAGEGLCEEDGNLAARMSGLGAAGSQRPSPGNPISQEWVGSPLSCRLQGRVRVCS